MSLIEPTANDAPWEAVARSVFWSRDVALDTWRNHILLGHSSYLPESVARMSSRNFIRFLQAETFLANWPQLRDHLPAGSAGIKRLDAAWSLLKSGTFNLPVQSALIPFTGRSREVFDAIVQHQGISIFEVAKLAGVPYRRAFDHVRALQASALVKSRLDTSGPRPKRRLYTL